MKFGTKVLHAGITSDPSTGAVMTPIFQTSTYEQKAPGNHKGFEYARSKNPTRSVLEANLAALENGKDAACFGSGMAAMDAVVKLLKTGDEVICCNDLYGGSYRLLEKVYKQLGIHSKYVDMSDVESITKHITDKTKLIWIETPTNPMLNLIDIKKISAKAKALRKNILVCVDNTFASPYLQNPLDLGADIVMHSVTKYINGHSDVVMGALITKKASLGKKIKFIQNASGAIPGPMDCFLTLRGIKTLHIRVERACQNAKKIAKFLTTHKKIKNVYYPGFKSHAGHKIAKSQMKDFGAMVSFDFKVNTFAQAKKVLSNTKLFTLAESLGGVESLIGHPATMTHASIPKEERAKIKLTDSLIRLSVGIEDADDLIADLEKALSKLGG